MIVGLNGQPISDYYDLRLRVSQSAPGEMVKLDIYRSGQKRQMTVTLGELPEKEAAAKSTPQATEDALRGRASGGAHTRHRRTVEPAGGNPRRGRHASRS